MAKRRYKWVVSWLEGVPIQYGWTKLAWALKQAEWCLQHGMAVEVRPYAGELDDPVSKETNQCPQ